MPAAIPTHDMVEATTARTFPSSLAQGSGLTRDLKVKNENAIAAAYIPIKVQLHFHKQFFCEDIFKELYGDDFYDFS